MGLTRRQFGLSAAAAVTVPLALAGQVPVAAHAAARNARLDPGQATDRAFAAYEAMQKQYYQPAVHLYHEQIPVQPGDNPYSYVWPFSQATRATLDMLGLPRVGTQYAPDVADRAQGLSAYYSPTPHSNNPASPPASQSPPAYASYVMPPLGGGGDAYYDDNEWVGLDGLQQHLMTGDAAALQRAEMVSTLIDYGWDTNPSDPDPGGIFWTQSASSHDRNTISNGPGAEIQARLLILTKQAHYLSSAQRQFAWVNQYLRAPNGLYWDHVSIDGTIEHTQWSYNQGVMLGAAGLLYQATGDRTYLAQAESIASAALTFYSQAGRIFTSDVIFDAILFRNLLLLDSIDRDEHRYLAALQAMQAYTNALWQAVDPTTGLVAVQPYDPIDLLVQAGFTQLNALLAWDRSEYQLIA